LKLFKITLQTAKLGKNDPVSAETGFYVTQSRAFFKDFPGGGGAFFEKGPFCEIIY
jgi:hypothetical protein